jgi:hypothetical protein
MVLDPWLWWVEMIVTAVVDATRDHGFESPVLHEWLPPATPWTYMDSLAWQERDGQKSMSIATSTLLAIEVSCDSVLANEP